MLETKAASQIDPETSMQILYLKAKTKSYNFLLGPKTSLL